MKKILLSLAMIVAVGAIVVGATGAFFSDTETSVGNTFTAGDIDLKIDNESYAIDYNIPGYNNPVGALVASAHTSWELTDLTVEKFFDFIDLKPGDYGEDTISIHVGSNDAWVCAAAQITEDLDNSITEPEDEDGDDGSDGNGELDEELNFVFWVDDGDNVLENCVEQGNECVDETQKIFLQGTLEDMGQAGQIALADSQHSILDGNNQPIPGDTTFYIAKAWCFGDLTAPGVPNNTDTDPVTRGETGIECNGANVDNQSQTDSVVGDLTFYAEQARNNGQFLCSDWQPEFELPEPRQSVGAVLSAYQAPGTCDVTVNGANDLLNTIQEGVDEATDGQTVCVPDGQYDETVHITTPNITLASENGPTNSSTINGGVIVDAAGVTVTGFIVIPGDTEGTTAGFYLKEPADNAVISYNRIDASGLPESPAPRGIINVINTDIDSVMIHNNEILGNGVSGTGIYTNPHTSDVWTIQYNDIDNFLAGIGQWNGADVLNNEFEHTTAGSEAIGVDNAWDANDGVANFNNFLNDTKFNQYGDLAGTVDAENNFFSATAATAVVGADIDADPEEGSAFPHN